MNYIRNLFAKIRRPTVRHGLFFGLILGVLEIIFSLISSYVDLGSLSSSIGWALFLILGFLAGQRAAQATGKISTGAIAGLFAGLIGAVLNELIYFIFVLIYLQDFVNLAKSSPPAGVNPNIYTPGYVLLNITILLLFEIILDTLIGAAGGAIGGMLGRKRALVDPYQETVFEVTETAPPTDDLEALPDPYVDENQPGNSAQ